jgi:2-(3-amino-3-carboxypropyl)histidine synthase
MKTIFIEAKYKGEFDVSKIGKLPSKVGVVCSVQFVNYLDKVEKYLSSKGVKVFVSKGNQANKGQILGCNASAAFTIKDKVDAFLYIGDGRFHPIAVGLNSDKPVFVFNPISGQFKELDKKVIVDYKKRKKGALINFYASENVGVLITSKSGQNINLDLINKKLEKFDKNYYYFMFETLEFNQLENFRFIDAWINTACPRIDEDIKVLNIEELV